MAKDNLEKEQFIKLRAEGTSFDNISKQLSISKPTLIKWSKELQKEIEDLIFIHTQNLLEQYKLTKQKKIESLICQLSKVYEELNKRDFAELSTKDLLFVRQDFETRLNRELEQIKLHTGENVYLPQIKFVEEILLNID